MRKLCFMCCKTIRESNYGPGLDRTVFMDGECCDFCNAIRYGDVWNINRVMEQIAEIQIYGPTKI